MTSPSKNRAERAPDLESRDDHARCLRDLSELLDRERVAHRRLAATNRVAASMMAKVADASRITLNVMTDWLRLLRREHLDAARRVAVLSTMDRIVSEQLELLDEIAAVGPLDGAPLHLALSEVDFGQLASNALAKSARTHSDVELTEQIAADGPALVIADRVRLARAMDRVFAAAARCAERPGRLDVWRRKELRSVSLRVVHRLRAGRAEEHDSLDDAAALDLSLARGVIEAHRGTLDVATDRCAGVRVMHARIPLVLPEKPPLDSLRILIACEDDETRDLVAFLARGNGAATLTAGDRATASRALAAFTPDIVIVADELAVLCDETARATPCIALVRRAATVSGASIPNVRDRIELPTSSRELVDSILTCIGRAEGAIPLAPRK